MLAFFTHKVSLPLLNFVEISSQEELLGVFLKLYEDLQCGKEYGFADKNEPARVTQLNLLTAEELAQLPTNNIPRESIFSIFDRKAVAAKSRNHKFKATSIRNDMTLYQSSVSNIPDQKVSAILKILNAREKEWDSKQRELHENKIIEKLKKTVNLHNKITSAVQNPERTCSQRRET